MINITKQGKFIIPENECFIGYAGDNLNTTKEIFVEGITDISLIYRMYLKFDDGTCNYFLLESEVQQGGTLLTWNITSDQIFKSGIVQVQIKASNDSGEVFHSNVTTMLVQTSIEFSDFFSNKENSEFLQYEKALNDLKNQVESLTETLTSLLPQAQEVVTQLESGTIDDAPTKNSEGLVKSGGVYSALTSKLDHKNTIVVNNLEGFKNLKEKGCIYDVNINAGAIAELEFPAFGTVYNYGDFQNVTLHDGRVFSRYLDGDTPFTQIGFTKFEIIDFINEVQAS